MRYRRRNTNRLPGYRYDLPGIYYVTICTHQRECLLGEVIKGKMYLNELGRIVEMEWRQSAGIRSEIELDAFVVMPDHLHGLVVLTDCMASNGPADLRTEHGIPPITKTGDEGIYRLPRSLGSFIAGFKSAATKRINEMRSSPGTKVWQRNYYDHIVRNEKDLNRIRAYIRENPIR